FSLVGPAARVDAEGRIGLAARDLDQLVVVTPRVSSALPLVGGLAAGPLGAFAMFVTQRVLEREIDKLTRYRYSVSGSWDNPVVERLGSNRASSPPPSLPEPFGNDASAAQMP